jgi:hypothetical protein
VEDAGVVPHGDPALVEAGGAGIAEDKAVGVVVDGDLTPQLFQSVLKLNEPDWDRVAKWDVEEDREHLLLKEARFELIGEEDGRQEAAALHPLLEVLREDCLRDVSHVSPPLR